MFGAVGFDAAGRWRPPPQDRRPSSSAPVADVDVVVDDIDDGGRRRRADDVVIRVCRDDDDDLGGENTISDGGTLVLSSVGGETMDDDEFTTFTNIVYGVVSPRLAVAGGGGCDDRHHHGGGEEDPHQHPPPRHRHHPRQGYKGAGAAAPVVAPSTGGAGQSDDSRDGTTTGTRTSCDSYYQMQRNGPYIAGSYMRQDEVMRNAESWNDTHQRVDLDDVDDDLRRRHSSVVGDYPQDAMDGIMGDFCGGKVECGHVAIGGGGGGKDGSSSVGNSTLSSLTHEAWLPRFDVRGRFLSYYVQAKSPTATTAKTESSPRTLSSPRTKSSKAGGRQPSIDTPVSEGVRSPATEFMGDVILGSGGGASPPPWHSAPRVRHVDDRNAPPPPIGGGIARPAPLRLTDRMTTGGHVPLDDADVVAASSRPPAEVILVKSTVKGLDICFANDGTNSVSHQLTPSSGSDGDLSHLIVSELRRRHMPGIRRSYADDDKPRYRWDCRAGTGGGGGGGRAVLCLLAALSLIGIVVGGVLGGRGAGSSRGSTPGYDVVVWGPDTQGACCVNGDVAKPEGMFGPGGLLAPPGEEEGGGEAPAPAPPLAGSGIFDAPNGGGGGGGGDDSDADPIDLAPLGGGAFDGIVAGATTAPPTRGPTGAEASPGGGGEPSPETRSPTFGPSKGPTTTTTRDPTAGDEPASTSPMAPTTSPPSTTNPTQESSSSIVPSAPRPAPTIPTSGPEAASPSASPTARVTPTTTTSPNPAGMPATASPSSSPSTAPTTTSPTAGVTSSPSASPTTAPNTTSPTAGVTASPSASPTIAPMTTSQNTESPVTESPTLSPSILPTTTVTLEPTEKPTELKFLGECLDEVKDGVDYQAGAMVSYRTSPMWKVYECLDGACVAEELLPEGPAGAWILLGLCAPTNDQLNGTDDDTPQPTSSPIKSDPSSTPPEVRNLPEDDLPDEEIVFD